jgi:hypothetical protein
MEATVANYSDNARRYGSAHRETPGPVVVLCRHVNIIDASIPTLLYQRLGYHTRGVIMAELLADPGFELIYRRTGSVFIPRDNGPEAVALLQHLREGIDESTAVDEFGNFLDLARAAPLARPIVVTAWRIPASDIPHEPNARVAWLDDQWLKIDSWIDQQLASAGTLH